MIVEYDGSFEGFLTLVHACYYERIAPDTIVRSAPNSLLLEEHRLITTDPIKAQKVLEALKSKFPKKKFETILHMFMCDRCTFECDLLEYIIIGFKDTKALENINYSAVFAIDALEKELFHNVHKMTGFLRFEILKDESLYAKVDSKFNLLYFLGRHFLKRFNNQNYIIHDPTRALAFVKHEGYSGVREVADFDLPEYSKDEQKFQQLWKTFFEHVSIKARKNERVQKSFVPLIYRTYMSEFE